jgi:hypothetical protein
MSGERSQDEDEKLHPAALRAFAVRLARFVPRMVLHGSTDRRALTGMTTGGGCRCRKGRHKTTATGLTHNDEDV